MGDQGREHPWPNEPHDSQDTVVVDTVVVGSGFGAAVTAYRLAEAGRSVLVPYPPGGFPRSPADMARNFWDPSNGLHGMFGIWSFRGLEGVVSSGLGGGSLIYANDLLRKDEQWFVHESPLPGGGYENWPIGRADLDPHYDRVERMLGSTPYPYAGTPKTLALHLAARRLGLPVFRPPLAVSFAPRPGALPVPGAQLTDPGYGNLHGLPRSTWRLCGECDVGCNYGAKNTLDHTCLSAARHHGADVRTRCEVRGFAPRPGGWDVSYVVHDPAREGRRTATDRLPQHHIGCRSLVLAAGTFGSTYLLPRNRVALPGLSGALGTRFCGNGDLLGMVLRATAGAGRARPLRLDGSRGPVITSAVRGGDALDDDRSTGRGFYIEDAGYPDFVAWLVESSQLPGGRSARGRRSRRLRLTITARDVNRFVTDPEHAADAVGHVDCDIVGGRLKVERGWFDLFTRDGDPSGRRMLYRLYLRTQEGTPLTLTGHKGAGVVVIRIGGFLQQLTTFRTTGPHPGRAMERFGKLFLGELCAVYGERPARAVPWRDRP
ncbi:hypothetical protein AB0L04_28945 [Streptomyces glaucescens]|uniref:hypothetical protein n=1 Tax=Streptomyces glaucescens TaxID=1907 RepID=UPI00344C92A4